MSDTNRRIDEIRSVAEEHHTRWLAGQIDEVESKVLSAVSELAVTVSGLTKELTMTRNEMARSSNRLIWTILSAVITLFVSTLVVVVSGVLTK